MNSKFIVKLALTTAVVAVPSVGCTSVGVSSTSKIATASAGQGKANQWARKAEKAFAKHNNAKALSLAEMAVEADSQNRDYRSLLARIYMAEGRFASAERTFMDVMELGQTDPRTVVSLALTRIAQGKVDSAISLVEANRSIIPASDYGLTLALAGQSKQAVDVLVESIRADNANARTRQNLALAYALNGQWSQARIMAAQDMDVDRVNDRIVEWAQYARPGAYETRIAGLLNVTPVADSGQPVRLALNAAPVSYAAADNEVPVDMAATVPAPVESAPVSLAAVDPNVELAAIGPAPSASNVAGFASVEDDVKVAAAAPASDAPLIKASSTPVKSEAVVPIKLALASVEPLKAAAPEKVGGTHVIQLGAFSSAANADKAWKQYSARYSALQGFGSASSTVKVGGKTLIRLAAMGFGNRSSADAVCRQIKSKGGDCVVKAVGGEQPVRMAANKGGRQIAAR